jgi:hypothetical protein
MAYHPLWQTGGDLFRKRSGQTLSDGKFRNGSSHFKGTQTGGVRVQNSTLIFPNEEKAASTGQSVAVIFPNGPGGETTSPKAGLHIERPPACLPKRLSSGLVAARP